jgi:hypothetical protein
VGTVIMHNVVSVDGFIADENDDVGPLHDWQQVVRLRIPRHVLSDHPTQSIVDRSRAIPYSDHGVERETRLELATLTLARYRFTSLPRAARFACHRTCATHEPTLATRAHTRHRW